MLLQFFKLNRWALGWLMLWGLIALLAPFLANDLPLLARQDGRLTSPVLRKTLLEMGLTGHDATLFSYDWNNTTLCKTPVGWGAKGIHLHAARLRPSRQHLLGTDHLGRDVLAMLIHAAGPAMRIGLVSGTLALLFGGLLGGASGFLGNDLMKMSWPGLIFWVATPLIFFWLLMYVRPVMPVFACCIAGLWLLLWLAFRRAAGRFFESATLAWPLDWLFNRFIEWWTALPKLLVIVIVAGLMVQFSATTLALLIALFEWPLIARVAYNVAHGLRYRLFIQSARVAGLPLSYQLLHHVAPRILISIIPLLAFLIAEAIVLESALSFLGIGLPLENPSWGRLLYHGRSYPKDWHVWLPAAVVLMVHLVVLQYMGQRLQRHIDNRYEI